MIRFIQTKIVPVIAAVISIVSTFAMEQVVTTPTTPVVTSVTPMTPTVTPAILQQFQTDLNMFNDYAKAGCVMCGSNVSVLAAETSVLMGEFIAQIPNATATVLALVNQSAVAAQELQALLLAFESFSSIITKIQPALKAYNLDTTSRQTRDVAKAVLKASLPKLNLHLNTPLQIKQTAVVK